MQQSLDDNIKILLDFDSNLDERIQETVKYTAKLESKLSSLQDRYDEIRKSRSKASLAEKKSLELQLSLLQKRIASERELSKSYDKFIDSKDIQATNLAIDSLNYKLETLKSRYSEIARGRTAALNEERRNIKSNIASLEERLAVEYRNLSESKKIAALDSKSKSAIYRDYTNWMSLQQKRVIDDMIKEDAKASKSFASNHQYAQQEIIKETKAANAQRLADTTRVQQQIADSEAKSIKFNRTLREQAYKVELAEMKKLKAERDAQAKKDKTASDRTWRGAWIGSDSGTTFGHKFLTTSQYALAGAAIYKVVEALQAFGVATLQADLNMRTMAAVLDLNIGESTKLSQGIRILGEEYGGSLESIQQVAIALGRAGIQTKDLTKATEITLKMARLTGDTFEQSSNAIISYQQVFGNTTSIEMLGDKLAYMANVSRLSTQDIGTLSNYALAAAKNVGLTEDAVGGLAAAFSNAGVNASTIGTQIRRFTTLLTDNSEAVTDFFNKAGVSQQALIYRLQQGGEESNKALLEFVHAIQNNIDSTDFTTLTGKMDILAANSLQLMRNNGDNIDKFVKDLEKGVKGQLDSVQKITDSYAVTLESTWNKILNIATHFGTLFADAFTTIFTSALNAWKGLSNSALAWFYDTFVPFGKAQADLFKATANQAKIQQEIYDLTVKKTRAEKEGDLVNAQYFQSQIDRYQKVDKLLDNQINKTFEMNEAEAKYNKEQLTRAKEVLKLHQQNANLLKSQGKAVPLETKNAIAFLSAEIKKAEAVGTTTKSIETQTSSVKAAGLSFDELQKSVLSSVRNTGESSKEMMDLLTEAKNESYKKINDSIKQLSNNAELAKVAKDIDFTSISQAGLLRLAKSVELKSNQKDLSKEEEISLKTALGYINDIRAVSEKKLEIDRKVSDVTKAIEDAKTKGARNNFRLLSDEQTLLNKEIKAKQSITDYNNKTKQFYEEILYYNEESLSRYQRELDIANSKIESSKLALDTLVLEKGAKEDILALEVNLAKAYSEQASATRNYYVALQKEEDVRKNTAMSIQQSIDEQIHKEQERLGLIKENKELEADRLLIKVNQAEINKKLSKDDADALREQITLVRLYATELLGAQSAFREYSNGVLSESEAWYEATKTGLNSLESGMMDFFDVTSDGWLDWKNLATSVLNDIYKQLLQQLVVKQLVSGIATGMSGLFSSSPGGAGTYTSSELSLIPSNFADGGYTPSQGFMSGGMISGGSRMRDDLYLGTIGGVKTFAMGGEFITKKSSVNSDTKNTLEYINKTGTTPTGNVIVNSPISIELKNESGVALEAELASQMVKQQGDGFEERVVSVIIKRSRTDSSFKNILKGA